jgi:diaminopimelate decarboxylase
VLAAVGQLGVELICEPGRSIIGPAGCLLTRVILDKPGFVVVDAAMTELIRPALYGAVHQVVPVIDAAPGTPSHPVDVVGPVCESGDILARKRELPRLAAGAWLAILGTGAYGMAMASTYNSRPRAAEVLVDGAAARLVRRRETIEDLLRLEE